MSADHDGERGGRIDRRILATLFRLEIKLLLRDKRTLFIAVILPLFLFPLIIFVMRAVERSGREKLESATYRYAIIGSEAEHARQLIAEALTRPLDRDDTTQARDNFVEESVGDPDSLLSAGVLHLVVEGMTADEFRAVLEREIEDDSVRAARLAAVTDVPVILLSYRANSEFSSTARRRMQERLAAVRAARRSALLRESGLPIDPEDIGQLELANVATAEKEGGAALGRFLTPLLVLLLLTGGSVVAADAISGEKERGTLETMLTTAAKRTELVASKQLAIIAVGLAITLINVANLLIYVASGLFELPESFAVSIPPLGVIVIFLLFLPLIALVSAVLLMVSGYSKTYKEYQIYFFPVLVLFVVPALASILPGIDLRSAVALVPVANVSVAVREVLIGEYDWIPLAITFAITLGAAVYASKLTVTALSTERLITAAELDEADLRGGAALFPKHVLRWFIVLWVVFFITSLWFGGYLDLRAQVTLNLVVLFMGAAVLMIRHYRLDPREALALRPVKAPVWLAVIIGAPSAFFVGIGIAQLANFVFPVPERMLQAFEQQILPGDMPLWQILFFLSFLPGVCEEVLFRGVLFHGLRKRFKPLALCLVVGAIFGFFHVDLFRLIPTAYIGFVLAAVVLITGSILPAMLWHALNNAVALVPAYFGYTETPPLWSAAAGLVGLAFAFWILWTQRSIYPDLRRPRVS